MAHQTGTKITSSHSTATSAAHIIVAAAHELDCVSKITLGIIKHIGGGGEKRLKFLPITGGTKAVVRGSGAVQEIFVYTTDVAGTEAHLAHVFGA